jgi:hypothetical protein
LTNFDDFGKNSTLQHIEISIQKFLRTDVRAHPLPAHIAFELFCDLFINPAFQQEGDEIG